MSDQSVSQSPELQLLIAGTTDVVRRLSAALRTTSDGAQPATRSEIPVSIITGTLAETKALAVAHRPDVLVVEVGFRTTARDIVWLRNTLSFLRERFSRNLHIVIAVTSSEVFTHAGELLFAEEPLAPSRRRQIGSASTRSLMISTREMREAAASTRAGVRSFPIAAAIVMVRSEFLNF